MCNYKVLHSVRQVTESWALRSKSPGSTRGAPSPLFPPYVLGLAPIAAQAQLAEARRIRGLVMKAVEGEFPPPRGGGEQGRIA